MSQGSVYAQWKQRNELRRAGVVGNYSLGDWAVKVTWFIG